MFTPHNGSFWQYCYRRPTFPLYKLQLPSAVRKIRLLTPHNNGFIQQYRRFGKFQCKKVRIAHTSMKLKHKRLFTMNILLSNKQYHASSFHSEHSCMLNVCDNNLYKAQMSTLFYYNTDKCIGRWHCGSNPVKDGLVLHGQTENSDPAMETIRMGYLIQEGIQ